MTEGVCIGSKCTGAFGRSDTLGKVSAVREVASVEDEKLHEEQSYSYL